MAETYRQRVILPEWQQDAQIRSYTIPGKQPALLPNDQIIPTAEKYVHGEIIPWQAPSAIRTFQREVHGELTIIRKLAIALSIPNPESEQALRLIIQDQRRFSPVGRSTLDNPPHLQDFFLHFSFTGLFWGFIATTCSTKRVEPTGPQQEFINLFQQQIEETLGTFKRFGMEDLPLYIRYTDLLNSVKIAESERTKNIAEVRKRTGDTLADSVYSPGYRLNELLEQTGERLEKNWEWPQIELALSQMPSIQSLEIKLWLLQAIENTLHRMEQEHGNVTSETLDLDPKGVVEILALKRPNALAPNTALGLPAQSQAAIPDFDRIRPHFPQPVISLLSLACELMREDQSLNLLQTVSRLVKERQLMPTWLTVLAALKTKRRGFAQIIDQVVQEFEGSNLITQILLDQIPGELCIAGDGKLHSVINGKGQKGTLIYVSTAVQPQRVEEPQSERVKPVKVLEVPIRIERMESFKHWGEVSIVSETDIPRVLSRLINSSCLRGLDQDKTFNLLADYEERAKVRRQNPLVILPYLLSPNHPIFALAEAGILGIEQDKETVRIFVDPKKAGIPTDAKTLIIYGRLDDIYVDIEASGEDYTESLLYPLLSAATLLAVTLFIPKDLEKDEISNIHSSIKAYNHAAKRVGLPHQLGDIVNSPDNQTPTTITSIGKKAVFVPIRQSV